jgi:hypothetical protein
LFHVLKTFGILKTFVRAFFSTTVVMDKWLIKQGQPIKRQKTKSEHEASNSMDNDDDREDVAVCAKAGPSSIKPAHQQLFC